MKFVTFASIGVKCKFVVVHRCVYRYEIVSSHEAFYCGGAIAILRDGSFLFTTCKDSVKVLDCSNGRVVKTLKEVLQMSTLLHLTSSVIFRTEMAVLHYKSRQVVLYYFIA